MVNIYRDFVCVTTFCSTMVLLFTSHLFSQASILLSVRKKNTDVNTLQHVLIVAKHKLKKVLNKALKFDTLKPASSIVLTIIILQ